MIDDLLTLKQPLPNGTVRKYIPSGYAGTVATIEGMRDCVDQGKRDFRIRTLAGQIIKDVPEKDYRGYAAAVHNWIRDNIKYALDPAGVETIEYPWKIVESKVADCDSSSILNAALCESLGLECRFRAIKADSGKKDEFSHVFSEVFIPGKGWMTSDCSMNRGFGWRPPDHYGAQNWPASHDNYENHEGDKMMGLAALGADRDTAITVLEKMYDGRMKTELLNWEAELAKQQKDVNALTASARTMTDKAKQTAALSQISFAIERIFAARQKFIVARNQYDFLAGEARRWGLDIPAIQSGFNGLSGLGAEFGSFGAIQIPAALLTAGGVIAAAVALAIALGSISDAVRGNDSIIMQAKKLVEAGGGVITSTGTAITSVLQSTVPVVLVGIGAYIVYLMAKGASKKGYI